MVLLYLTEIDSKNEFTFIDEERGEILVKIENLSEKKNYENEFTFIDEEKGEILVKI